MNHVLFSRNSDEWSTPDYLFNALNSEFHFTLDPCASSLNHKCEKYYDIESDGLSHYWKNEIVFVNPPYSNISKWAEKCCTEYLNHNATIVLLVPSRTDTKWFHDYVYGIADIRFIKGRLRFSNKDNAPFPSMICIYK